MKLHGKYLGLASLLALVALSVGCSGINASQSVSPATFLLPGFGQKGPVEAGEVPVAAGGTAPAPQVAALR